MPPGINVRRQDDKPPAGLQDTPALSHQLQWVVHMLDHMAHYDRIKAFVIVLLLL